jgi:2-polyprenyl-3-methyl-5-hydroxy-6-metoxy-1,4-benzoquinol methylase
MKSLAIRARDPEQMDADDLDAATYAAVLGDLASVNAITLARLPTLGFLRRALGGRNHFRLLDVGYGQGDMLRSIARWAQRSGMTADLVGIDLNPNSAPAAQAATPPDLAIDYRTGDCADLEGPNNSGGGFDLIVSSLVAHHMTDAQLVAFLRFMEKEARVGWLINDIHRLRLAHVGFPILARLFGWHRIVREDGTLSVARGFRPAEWRPYLAEANVADVARVRRRFPFRLCVERLF